MNQLPLCAHCGQNPVKKRENRYCSPECSGAAKVRLTPICCKQCGKTYKPTNSKANQEFCSSACRVDHGMKTSACLNCGEEFKHKGYKARKYCCNHCVSLHYAPLREKDSLITSVCPICNKSFRHPSSSQRVHCSMDCYLKRCDVLSERKQCQQCGTSFESLISANQKFCSHACYAQSMENKSDRICAHCGSGFQCKPCEATRHCSKKCADQSLKIEGSHAGYGPEWPTINKAIRERDGYKCVRCGLAESGRAHDVHHMIPLRTFKGDLIEANDPSNLVTLCRSCHSLVECGSATLQLSLI